MTAAAEFRPEPEDLSSVIAESPGGNVVPLRAASERAVDRQFVAARAARVASENADLARKPTPIFGSAVVHLPQWPITLVICGMAIGLIVAATNSFHAGCIVLGASLAVASFLRLVLTDRDAGMLKVRGRVADLFVLGGFAVGLLVFAFWVPAPN